MSIDNVKSLKAFAEYCDKNKLLVSQGEACAAAGDEIERRRGQLQWLVERELKNLSVLGPIAASKTSEFLKEFNDAFPPSQTNQTDDDL